MLQIFVGLVGYRNLLRSAVDHLPLRNVVTKLKNQRPAWDGQKQEQDEKMGNPQTPTAQSMSNEVLNQYKLWLNGDGQLQDCRHKPDGSQVFFLGKVYLVPEALQGLERVTTELVPLGSLGASRQYRLPTDPVQRAKMEAMLRDLEAARA